MRTVITVIIVWALLIGFVISGVRTMASAPSPGTFQAISGDNGEKELHRIDIDRSSLVRER
jgi:hypothetical protein